MRDAEATVRIAKAHRHIHGDVRIVVEIQRAVVSSQDLESERAVRLNRGLAQLGPVSAVEQWVVQRVDLEDLHRRIERGEIVVLRLP